MSLSPLLSRKIVIKGLYFFKIAFLTHLLPMGQREGLLPFTRKIGLLLLPQEAKQEYVLENLQKC